MKALRFIHFNANEGKILKTVFTRTEQEFYGVLLSTV